MRQIITFNNKNWPFPEAKVVYQTYDYLHIPADAQAVWDTGLNTNTNDIEIELQVKLISNATTVSSIYGSDFAADGQLLYSQYTSGTNGVFKFHAGNHSEQELTVSNFLDRWITINQTTSSITIDGQVYSFGYLACKSANLLFFNVPAPIPGWYFKDGMIKYIKIKRGNNLLFDLIPAVELSTGKKGFKNLVNNGFIEVEELVGSIIMGNE